MTDVLLVESDELELRERTEQLLMDGYAVDVVAGIAQARGKLAEGPDVLVLSSGPETIGLLRELRAGAVPRADSRLPVFDPRRQRHRPHRCRRAGIVGRGNPSGPTVFG